MSKLLFRLIPPLLLALAACEEGLQPVSFQGISGTVSFVGQPPDSTEWVRLVIYRDLPQAELDLLQFVTFSDPLDLGGSSADYVLALEPGVYRWLPAGWKKEGEPLSAQALRVLGWFTSGDDAFAAPDSVVVTAETETAEIDLTADFDALLTVDEVLALLETLQ